MAIDQHLIDTIDVMSKDQALAHVKRVLDATIEMRNRYEEAMLDDVSRVVYEDLWKADNQNILDLKRLLYDISQE